MEYKNEVFAQTVAHYPGDAEASLRALKPLEDAGYQIGLMVFTQEGMKSVTDPGIIAKQYANLEGVAGEYGDSSLVCMLSEVPIGEMDHYSNTKVALNHVLRGIDFARGIPIGRTGRRKITFHLNSLVRREEFTGRTQADWMNKFDFCISPSLKEIGKYASDKGVQALVETTPVPEFGDEGPEMNNPEKHFYLGRKRSELVNPFHIFKGSHVERAIRDAGLGICLDICHSRTIYLEARHNNTSVLFDRDIKLIKGTLGNLIDDVGGLWDEIDLVHLNDGDGRYTPEGGVFREGVALGKGELSADGSMPQIVRTLNSKRVPFVLEINERFDDIKAGRRPETDASVEYLLAHS